MTAPQISVVVLAYNARGRIDTPLRCLRAQDLAEPYEVVLVDSGGDGCGAHVQATYPEVHVVCSPRRLWPGAARNLGVSAARGPYLAFLSDDVVVKPDWLRLRLARHRAGFAAVGGAVINAAPSNPIATAGHYLEYSAQIPSDRILAEQQIPHTLSYERELIERLGGFPEDTPTGEDTVLNQLCVEAGVPIAVEPAVQVAHRGPGRPRDYLRHHYGHGRGLVRCVDLHGHCSPVGSRGQPTPTALWRTFAVYPATRWWSALKRIARGRARSLPAYLTLTPLVWAGLVATSAGAWAERRARGRGGD